MGEIRQEKSGFAAWTDRHAELWKFMKFLLAGGGSNVVELAVHMLLLNTVFAALTAEPVTRVFSQPHRYYIEGISVYLYGLNDRGLYDCVYIEPQDHL